VAKKSIAFPEGLEPSCYHTATSERRHIQSKADYYFIALREASIKRSQCGNSEAIVGGWVETLQQPLKLKKSIYCILKRLANIFF